MKRATSENRGIQWGLTSFLEDLDFADDISLLSHSQEHMQQKTDRVTNEAASVGLKLNSKKTKMMRICARNEKAVTVGRENIEEVQSFNYLGSTVNADGNIMEEVNIRIGKAAGAFKKLRNIWKSRKISRRTKIRLYVSNVRSVLLYGAETWRTTRQIESKVRGFEGRCLRRIVNIRWPELISNRELAERTGVGNIVAEIKRRKWRYIGHVLRMGNNRYAKRVLKWTPPGKRKPGRPKGTWRRSVEAEMKEEGITWLSMERTAQNRTRWRALVEALCVPEHEED